MRRLFLLYSLLLAGAANAQDVKLRTVDVDEQGVMRWADDRSQVALFGVNYTAPFAYAYRALGYVKADRKAAIDMDVSHIARLGLDAYRIHVWDRQVSDSVGNLLENDHLDLLDYLISRLEQRGIHVILTPIFWGGAGYPERDPPTPGFSNRFSKGGLTIDSVALHIQRNYFSQFVRHANKYTGRSYSDDPGLIAIELFNEPDHPGTPEEQTRYINELVTAVRAAGFRKPVLYNVSQGWSQAHAKAVCSANIQGVTFQWYPTGLVRGSDIRTNMLPNVDSYPIPHTPECANKARLVYEFDAADVMGSYMYPAIARSFRAAGMQWATQFAYDPAAIAFANTEYPTHYLNLLYTPKKAISLLIAAEAFRRLPRGQSYGAYPRNARFDDFSVSYERGLSELNTPVAFYYSSSTSSRPVRPALLRHVAGVGCSSVVDYEGSGAYFLDRLDTGVWRLEVYPDAVALRDPFGRNTIEREVTRLFARARPIRVRLADLGSRYRVTAVNHGNQLKVTAVGGAFTVSPGVYVLSRHATVDAKWRNPQTAIGNRTLGEFVLPERVAPLAAVVHRPQLEIAPRVRVAGRSDPITLFDARRDALRMLYPHPWQYVKFNTSFVPAEAGAQAFRFAVDNLEPSPHQFAMRSFLGEENRARMVQTTPFRSLRIRARSAGAQADSMRVALVQRDGTAWGGVIVLGPEWREVTLAISALQQVPLALLPRPYPHFLPEELTVETVASVVDLSQVDGVQFGINANMYEPAARTVGHGFEVEWIQLRQEQ